MVTTPVDSPRISDTVCSSCSSQRASSRRTGSTRFPSSVSDTPRRPRRKMGKPNSASTAFIMWATPEGV